MPTNRFSWVALVVLLAAPVQTFAQESVESRVQSLEETVQLLERRIATLEAALRQQSAPAAVPSGKEGWRKLQKGMSETDVERLLGSPSKINVRGFATFWYYGYPSGGEVWFDPDTRKVGGWSEP